MQSPSTPTESFRDNPGRHRYELTVDGRLAAIADYTEEAGGVRRFTHTEVMPEFEGRGIGSRIAKSALDDVRSRGGRLVAQCPFIRRYIDKHAEYAELLAR